MKFKAFTGVNFNWINATNVMNLTWVYLPLLGRVRPNNDLQLAGDRRENIISLSTVYKDNQLILSKSLNKNMKIVVLCSSLVVQIMGFLFDGNSPGHEPGPGGKS